LCFAETESEKLKLKEINTRWQNLNMKN
jgi:hypothetical protein